MAGMFGSENAANMVAGQGQQFGGMDPLVVQEMMRNIPELRARQRKAEMLRGIQRDFAGQAQGGPQTNYQPTTQGGLFQTVAQFQPDYGALGQQAVGALGGYLGEKPAAAAEGAYDQMQAQEVMRAMQQYGGGNQGGRMTDSGSMAAGLDAASAGAGNGYSGNSAGTVPIQPGVVPGRQNAAMALRGNKTLSNLSQWFGQ